MSESSQTSYQVEIFQLLLKHYGDEDLRTLCFELGLNYDDLPAAGRKNKARELVQELVRHGRLPDLQPIVLEDFPTAAWPAPPSVSPTPSTDQTSSEQIADPFRTYHENLVETLSGPRWQLDSRFVDLTLLLDRGPDAQDIRFAPDPTRDRFQSLGALLEDVDDQTVVILGKPGSGKTTLLRRLELELVWAQLDRPGGRTVFFMPLNAYRSDRSEEPPDPHKWLAAAWARRNPGLPPFEELFSAGQLLLLLDGLNEMPHRDSADYRERIGAWQMFNQDYAAYGNTVVFSCRSLDYSAPLSSEFAPVPQVRVEPLSPAQIRDFLNQYLADQAEAVWGALSSNPEQLKLFSTPFFLRLLVDQVAATGEVPAGQASLLTGFVRRTLYREVVQRQHRLFRPGILLSENDVQQIIQRAWSGTYALPGGGALLPGLAGLAFAMQDNRQAGEAAQVRLAEEEVLDLLDQAQARLMVEAGIQLNVLDKELATNEVTFTHQLLQEYFAARVLAERPDPSRVAVPWRAAEMDPSLAEALEGLETSDPLPPAPATGWEETAVLSAAMSADQEGFVAELMAVNLPLAARCAIAPEVHVPALHGRLQQALLDRTGDKTADLRARIAAAETLGELGDPRFQRRAGPDGDYLLPPLATIPGGTYTMGDDESQYDDEKPAHPVEVEAFELGVFPVTNAEYALFIQAGGYQDERWWETAADRAWLRGESSSEGQKAAWRDAREALRKNWTDEALRAAPNFTPEQIETYLWFKNAEPDEVERQLDEWYPEGQIYHQPDFWDDSRFNGPGQPVVGVSWFEARAYCAWLSAQSDKRYTLPTEAEWEAAARGQENRLYAYGHRYDADRCNTFESHIRGTTPVGVYPGGYTPEGVADLSGNVWEWTSTVYRDYSYSAADGREDEEDVAARRVVRGGSWRNSQYVARAAYRFNLLPSERAPSIAVFGWPAGPHRHDH